MTTRPSGPTIGTAGGAVGSKSNFGEQRTAPDLTLDYPTEDGFTPMPTIIPGEPPPTSTGGDADAGPATPPAPLPGPSGASLFEQLALTLFPGTPPAFIAAFADAYVQYEDQPNATQLTLTTLRDDSRYDAWFPGNRRPDGTVRIGETDYWNVRADYEAKVRLVGVEPSIFDENAYVSLITGDVRADEFGQRVRTMAAGVLQRAPEFRQYFSQIHGIDGVSDGAILRWAFGNDTDALVRDVGRATIGFEGEFRNFDVGLQLAASLYDAGIQSQGQAVDLFGSASEAVPLFGRLAQRHFDPGDEFDLGRFLEAAVFDDQEAIAQQRRLLSQERALFSQYRPLRERAETGAVVGLLPE